MGEDQVGDFPEGTESMELCGRRFDTGEAVRVEVDGQKVAAVRSCAGDPAARGWPWIAPGLVDIQINGYGGQEFSSMELTVEKVCRISQQVLSFGVTGYCPTVTTESFEVLEHALRTIAQACESSPEVARHVRGIHLEGPYLSTEEGPRGAHPVEHCRRPDWDEFQRLQAAAGGRICLHTMAVEFEEAPSFIQQLVAAGVIVGIGHTAADAVQIARAVEAGARLSTHLGNGSHLMIPRHRGYIWEQLAQDRLMASLIGDGHHLPPAVLKTFIRAKTPQRCILVSDMSGQAGQPPGRYASRFCDVEILPNGRLVVAGQHEIMAGASSPVGCGIANAVRFAGLRLETAIRMAAHNPAGLLGITPGGLSPGDPADLVLFRFEDGSEGAPSSEFAPVATVLGGRLVWQSPDPP